MVSTCSIPRFRLEILDYLPKGSVYFGNFSRCGEPKLPYYYFSERNLGVNDKIPGWPP